MKKKEIVSWCFFDFANSSYSAVISAVIFPVYYANMIVGNRTGEGDLWWGRAISVSMLFIALSSPFLGGIADYAGARKKLLAIYTGVCVAAVSGFSILAPGARATGFFLIVLAHSISFSAVGSTIESAPMGADSISKNSGTSLSRMLGYLIRVN